MSNINSMNVCFTDSVHLIHVYYINIVWSVVDGKKGEMEDTDDWIYQIATPTPPAGQYQGNHHEPNR